MLLVMLGICIIVFIISLRKYSKSNCYGDPLLAISGLFGALLLLCVSILGSITITCERVYPQKKHISYKLTKN